ncbi:MAG: sulfotransferase family 2 domain-containing protein [Flavobacteriales bacterium]
MLISKRHRFIFFHVPKAAGSSITAAFQRYSDFPYARLYHYLFELLGKQRWLHLFPRHISPLELKEELGEANFTRYFKFAFVRNPFDWHVSQFHFHKQKKGAYFHETFKDMSFEDYVEWAVENTAIARSLQKRFLSDEEGELLVDHVGKVEHLNDDLAIISERLGLQVEVLQKNKSERKEDYRKHYNERMRRLIEESHQEDLEAFGYSF